jgi:hypothetical protein
VAAVIGLALTLCGAASGQLANVAPLAFAVADAGSLDVAFPRPASRLSPEHALAAYERGLREQSAELAGYTATTVIDAELPESAQRAEFELKRHYAAPSVLEFTPVQSSGDKFVKTNVIARVLQSEIDHVRRREQGQTAISSENYKFSYKGMQQLGGATVHVYEVKPKEKRVGLFRGKIFVESSSGRLVRAQGTFVKSPSFFIKKIQFVQDYARVGDFTLPTHLHSEAETRLVGKTIVDITHTGYQPQFNAAAGSLDESAALGNGASNQVR